MISRTEIQNSNPVKYGDWLLKEIAELNLSSQEVADEIGADKKTIERYITGENNNVPSAETMDKIDRFFIKMEHFKNKMSDPHALSMFLHSIKEKLCLNQNDIAIISGKAQGTISKLISEKNEKNLTTKEQFDILMSLFSTFEGNYTDTDFSSLDILDEIGLRLGVIDFEPVMYDEYGYNEEEESGYSFWLPLYWIFEECDETTQEMILTYPHAFFEEPISVSKNEYCIKERIIAFNKYKQMNFEQRELYVSTLDLKEKPLSKNSSPAEEYYFRQRNEMGILCFEANFGKKEGKTDSIRKENCVKFNKLMHKWKLHSDAEADLKMKILFTKEDWYIWRLLLIDAHNKVSAADQKVL